MASKCPDRQKVTMNSCAVVCPQQRKHLKNVFINGIPTQAIIDTGSDIMIMPADEFIRVGSPTLIWNSIPFCGVGKGQNATIGKFSAKLTVDGNSYTIAIYVVSDEFLRHGLLLGNDFLNTAELNVKCGVATIIPIARNDNAFAKICQISIGDVPDTDSVDLSFVSNDERKERVQTLFDNYRPEQTLDVGIQMKIVLTNDESISLRPRRKFKTATSACRKRGKHTD